MLWYNASVWCQARKKKEKRSCSRVLPVTLGKLERASLRRRDCLKWASIGLGAELCVGSQVDADPTGCVCLQHDSVRLARSKTHPHFVDKSVWKRCTSFCWQVCVSTISLCLQSCGSCVHLGKGVEQTRGRPIIEEKDVVAHLMPLSPRWPYFTLCCSTGGFIPDEELRLSLIICADRPEQNSLSLNS